MIAGFYLRRKVRCHNKAVEKDRVDNLRCPCDLVSRSPFPANLALTVRLAQVGFLGLVTAELYLRATCDPDLIVRRNPNDEDANPLLL